MIKYTKETTMTGIKVFTIPVVVVSFFHPIQE